jgi:VIT1/CCC1 family predicted Fe2+/Mn2+ transporter
VSEQRSDDLRETVFGMFDGLTSALGVIAGLIVAGAHSGPKILAAALGLAVAACCGMGAGQYLSDTRHSLRLAAVMAAATLLGSIAPALPFLAGYGTVQVVTAGAIVLAGGFVIGHFRGYRISFGVLTVVCGLTVALSALVA